MTINGKVGEVTYTTERARYSDQTLVDSAKVVADQGTLPVGLVMTENASDELVPYQEVAAEVLGTGDDATAQFTGTLAQGPIEPGSVSITDGTETFSDDGIGRLVGDAGGSGSVFYDSGAVDVTFNANVGNGTDVTVDYVTGIDAVLDEGVDTTKSSSAVVARQGPVRKAVLKVGATAQAAPSATLLNRMRKKFLLPR